MVTITKAPVWFVCTYVKVPVNGKNTNQHQQYSIFNPLGYGRPKAFLHYVIKSGSMPFVSIIFTLLCPYKWVRLLDLSHPEFIQVGLHLLGRSSFPIPTPSLPPISFAFKYFGNGTTAFSGPSRPANHLLSTSGSPLNTIHSLFSGYFPPLFPPLTTSSI